MEEKQQEEYKNTKDHKLVQALAQVYLSIHRVDLHTGEYEEIKSADFIRALEKPGNSFFKEQIPGIMQALVTDNYKQIIADFVNVADLEERMKGKSVISVECEGKYSGWCCFRFIKEDEDEDGHLWHVIYTSHVIDEVKRRENSLRILAETDQMTGLYNRRCGEDTICQTVAKKAPGLFCLIDCDKFKSVNDTYGHAVGDKVIISVAQALKSACRDNDIVMRLGGDEFAVFCKGDFSNEDSQLVANRIFNRVAQISIPEMGGGRIFISMGQAYFDGLEDKDFDMLYHEADKALYTSKRIAGYSVTKGDDTQVVEI